VNGKSQTCSHCHKAGAHEGDVSRTKEVNHGPHPKMMGPSDGFADVELRTPYSLWVDGKSDAEIQDVSLGVGDFARALTSSERRNQRCGRWGAEMAWNPVGLGGPTAAGSNGETNGDAKFFERLRRRAGRCRQRAPKSAEGKDLAPRERHCRKLKKHNRWEKPVNC